MDEIQSLARGLKILLFLAESENGAGVTEIGAVLGVNKGTASRMIQTLRTYGFVEKAADGRRYQLGPALFSLGRAVTRQKDLRELAKPYLKELVKLSGECAHLAIYAQGQALYIDQEDSDATLRVNVEIGQMAPLHCTALGKVLLAFGSYPPPENLERFTDKTITDSEALEMALAEIGRLGFAVDDEEYDWGVRCLAAPVYDNNHAMIAAIGISGPSSRLSLAKLTDLSTQIVDISKSLSNKISQIE